MLLRLFAKRLPRKVVAMVKLKEDFVINVEFDLAVLLVIPTLCLYSRKGYC